MENSVHNAAVVTYRVCENCGFKLMRSERVHAGGVDSLYALCPVCNRKVDGTVVYAGDALTEYGRRRAWAAWLYEIGLTPDGVQRVYHLRVEDFFERGLSA